jgi:hypothetical protein
MRLPAGFALAMVVGLVLGTDASAPIAGLTGVAAILALGGILGRSLAAMGVSAGLLVVAYTLALVIVAPGPGIVTPALIGTGLVLFLVTGDAVARGGGAPIDREVLAAWLRDVTGAAILAGAAAVAVGAAGSGVALDLPIWVYPPLAAAAALAILVGTGRALVAVARASSADGGEDA